MANTNIEAVVLPVYDKYLAVLCTRSQDLTTMVWGWQGNARRMARPAHLRRRQPLVPFLFRSDVAMGQVTHTAISGLIVHKVSPEYPALAHWLRERRIEIFAHSKWDDEVASFYAATAGQVLANPIPFQDLTLVSEGRALAAGMTRGYAMVFLPESLVPWYEKGVETWSALGAMLPKNAA
jgi:hypothetical protein